MKAINIIWDFCNNGDEEDALGLPSEIEIPKELENDSEAISDYLSDQTGFCHFGYELI